ncbi:MAG: glycosyltransferase [Chloroflexi bacterium]|nr:glycosyltransferase [Chloroflexota bacterium]
MSVVPEDLPLPFKGDLEAPFHVVQISKVRMNPYVRRLQEALQQEGIPCSLADGLSPRLVRLWQKDNPPSARRLAARVQPEAVLILHLHWLELLYNMPTWLGSSRRLVSVLAGLLWAKATGCKVVYTVHNLSPHERAFPILDGLANRMLFSSVVRGANGWADALHVHDEEARKQVGQIYGRQKGIHVIPHGSYIGAYPNECTKQEARARLELAESAFVFLFLGQIRRYKGIEDLLRAFSRLGDRTSQLVIAGNLHDPQYGQALARAIEGQQRIRLSFQYVPDSEVQYFMNASDVCVLPYRDVTTSGAAILAFSFGRPIIAPALGGFPALAAEGRGIVYDPTVPDGLLGALREALGTDTQRAGQQAWAWAQQHAWPELAPRFARLYAEALKARD